MQQFQAKKGQLKACIKRLRNNLLHDLANLSEEGLLQEIRRHLGQNADLETLVVRLKRLKESSLGLQPATLANPRVDEQLSKESEALKQDFKQVTQGLQGSEKSVFDEINEFVLQKLSEAWKLPLPP